MKSCPFGRRQDFSMLKSAPNLYVSLFKMKQKSFCFIILPTFISSAEEMPLPFFYLLTGNRKRSDLYRRTSYVNEALFDVVADLGYVIHHFVEVTAYDEERNGSVKLTVLDNDARRLDVERARNRIKSCVQTVNFGDVNAVFYSCDDLVLCEVTFLEVKIRGRRSDRSRSARLEAVTRRLCLKEVSGFKVV